MTQSQYTLTPTLAREPETSSPAHRVRSALADLEAIGDADVIAKHLLSLRVTGYVGWAGNCPVSNYVRVRTGLRIYVCSTAWSIADVDAAFDGWMPPNVKDFIERFDGGYYRSLEDKPTLEERLTRGMVGQ